MPSFNQIEGEQVSALVQFLISGESRDLSEQISAKMKYRFTGYHRFYDPEGYPAVAPPWGTLNAIDLNSGEYLWKTPLGECPEVGERWNEGYWNRKLRGTDRYCRRLGVHRRHEFRPQIPRPSIKQPASCCGRQRSRFQETRLRLLTRSMAVSTW